MTRARVPKKRVVFWLALIALLSIVSMSILQRYSLPIDLAPPAESIPCGVSYGTDDPSIYLNDAAGYAVDRQAEGTIAVSSLNSDRRLAAWIDYRDNPLKAIGYSIWNSTYSLYDDMGTIPALFSGNTSQADPSVVADNMNADVFYLGLVAYNSDHFGIYFLKTTNYGDTWAVIKQMDNDDPSRVRFDDKPWMIMNKANGYIYFVWIEVVASGHYNVVLQKSTDKGDSWLSAPKIVGTPPTGSPVLPFLTLGPQGQVYVIWMRDETPTQFYFQKSTDHGSTFSSPRALPFTVDKFGIYGIKGAANVDMSNIPHLSCNPVSGTLYLTWNDSKDGVGDIDSCEVLFSRSTDQGTSWSTPINVVTNSSTIPSAGDQFHPWIITGTLNHNAILYHDTKDDPASEESNVFLSSIVSDGTVFLPPVKISGWRSKLRIDFTGHYNGMAGENGYLYPIWSDSRAEIGPQCAPDQYSAQVPESDVFSAGLYNVADQNKSGSNTATSSNNARHLVKDAGKLHEVFSSAGEIYYRRMNRSTFAWDTTIRISSISGVYDYQMLPCLWKAADNSLHLVWQRKNGTLYDLYYSKSTNSGDSWSVPTILPGCSGISASGDQNSIYPVIAELTSTTPKQLIVVFVRQGTQYVTGPNYQKSTDNGNTWMAGPVQITNCGLFWTSNYRIWYPSLAAGSNYLTLTYGYRSLYPYVFSKKYDGTTWSTYSNMNAGIGTIQDRHPSVAVDGDGKPIAAWCAGRSGQVEYRIIFRQGNTDNTWSSWFVEFPYTTGVSDLYPSITHYNNGLSDPYALNIIYHRTNNQVVLKDFSRFWNQWLTTSTVNATQWPSISTQHGSAVPFYIMTRQSSAPYEVLWGGLPKAGHPAPAEKNRMIVFEDAENGSVLTMELSKMMVTTDDNKTISIPFRDHDPTVSISLDITNVWEYLGTEEIILPSNARWLSVRMKIESHSPSDSSDEGERINSFKGFTPEFRVKSSTHSGDESLAVSNGDKEDLQIDVSKFAGMTSKFLTRLTLPKEVESRVIVGVGDILRDEGEIAGPDLSQYQSAVASQHALIQNYPNPFNPSTTIIYELARGGVVKISLFDILGQEIKILVDEYKPTGAHEITIEGSAMQSGVYFCRLQVGDYSEVIKMMLLK